MIRGNLLNESAQISFSQSHKKIDLMSNTSNFDKICNFVFLCVCGGGDLCKNRWVC